MTNAVPLAAIESGRTCVTVEPYRLGSLTVQREGPAGLVSPALHAAPGPLKRQGFAPRIEHSPCAGLGGEAEVEHRAAARLYEGEICGEPVRDLGLTQNILGPRIPDFSGNASETFQIDRLSSESSGNAAKGCGGKQREKKAQNKTLQTTVPTNP